MQGFFAGLYSTVRWRVLSKELAHLTPHFLLREAVLSCESSNLCIKPGAQVGIEAFATAFFRHFLLR